MAPIVNIEKLRELSTPVVEGQGLELVELEWQREPTGFVLRLYIDRQNPKDEKDGVSLKECSDVSQELSAVLDVSNTITVPYSLEVSSPGLNRPLKKESDFQRFVGKKAKIRTKIAIDDTRRNFSGTLLGVDQGKIQIDVGDRKYELAVADIEKANLIYEF